LNVLPAGGFQRTLCERGSNYPRSTNNKFTVKKSIPATRQSA
jgi:hypothetical protein